jgi:hypothetical protein
MADQTLITQSQLADLSLALAQEGNALAFHASQSMSQSHGFNVLPGPYTDSYGNVVGTAQLYINIDGVDYFAPITPTSLAGQPPLAGVTPDLSPYLQPGPNYWVTDYTAQSAADAGLVMSGLLLPHTRLDYWQVHGQITAFAQNTTNSQGAVVGDHILQLFFNEQMLWIPCSTTYGGPAHLNATFPTLWVLDNITAHSDQYQTFLFSGIPNHTYTLNCKVRGVTEIWGGLASLDGTNAPSSIVQGTKVRPFAYLGDWPPNPGAPPTSWSPTYGNEFVIKDVDGYNMVVLMAGTGTNSVAGDQLYVYLLNGGNTWGGSNLADYTFSFAVTTNSWGTCPLTLCYETVDGNSAGGQAVKYLTDFSPPLVPEIQAAINSTAKYQFQWVQIDLVSITG